MVAIMAKYKSHVEVVPVDYKYSFGNQNEAKTHRNTVQEYLLLDIDRGLSYERTNQNMAGGQYWSA